MESPEGVLFLCTPSNGFEVGAVCVKTNRRPGKCYQIARFYLVLFCSLSLSRSPLGRRAEEEWAVRCTFDLCSGPAVPSEACHLLAPERVHVLRVHAEVKPLWA